MRRVWIVDIFDLWLDNAVDLGYVDDGSIGYRIVNRLEEIAFVEADHIIVLTPTMKEYYLGKYHVDADRLTPIPFGVDKEMFTPAINRDPESRVIYIGNLGTYYAFDPYVRAFAQLDDRYELYIVGWGEQRDELERLCSNLGIEDRVTFTGRIPREEIPELLASSAVSWVPLETDYQLDYARPTKMIESMAVGTPYVASALNEIEVVTEASEAGYVVENEPDQIADAMQTLLEDASQRRLMGEQAVAFIDSEHRWEVLSERVKSVLLSAVKNY